jgi:hypothetical protein
MRETGGASGRSDGRGSPGERPWGGEDAMAPIMPGSDKKPSLRRYGA